MSSAKPKPRRPLTIGLHLTLWGAGITISVCLLLCVFLYTGLRFSLQHEVDAFLEGEVNEFRAILDEHKNDYQAAQKSIRLELGQRVRLDLSFRLLDMDGHVVLTSDLVEQPPGFWMPPADKLMPGRDAFHTIQVAHVPVPVRLCSQRFKIDGKPFIAQAGYRLDQMTASLVRFRQICIYALAVAGLGALLGGRMIANRSLLPVQTMIAKARQIGERRLHDRLPSRGTGDELDRLAETLNALLDRVQRYVRRMQQFTADASHELRSPLAVLRGNAEVMLSRERSADELRRSIEESVDHFERLSRIAEDLLLLARFDGGEGVLNRENVRLDLALADIVDLYSPLANDVGIDLHCAVLPEVSVKVDGGRIRQVVGNLVDNAIKFTPAPGRVEVSLVEQDGEVRIAVSDTGVGISAEDHARIFDRFYRVDRSRSRLNQRGAGLGLSICRTLVEAHGGQIELTSSPGQGTTVTVHLPRTP